MRRLTNYPLSCPKRMAILCSVLNERSNAHGRACNYIPDKFSAAGGAAVGRRTPEPVGTERLDTAPLAPAEPRAARARPLDRARAGGLRRLDSRRVSRALHPSLARTAAVLRPPANLTPRRTDT